mmetsp:Transcript_537/g.867  ORF Transcript_537/g.867 Transcript_537/m.867 type:complete len:341 (-) Transcript_537:692-1714(-)
MYGSMRRQPKSIPSSILTSASALAISSERRIASERSFAVRLLKRWCTNSLAAFSNRFASESSFFRRALLASAPWNSFTLSASWIITSSFSIASCVSFIRVLCAFKSSTAWMISAAVSSLRLGFVSSGDGNHRALIASINAAADISSCAFVGSLNQPRSPNIAAGEMQSNPFATSFSSVAFSSVAFSSIGSFAPTVDVFITTCSSSGLSFFSSTSAATSSALTDSATISSFAFVGSLNHPLKLPHIAVGEQQSNPFAASVAVVGFSVSTVDAFMTTTCTSSVLSVFSSTDLTSTTSTTCKGMFSSTGASGAAATSGAAVGATMGVDSIAADLEFWVRFFLS